MSASPTGGFNAAPLPATTPLEAAVAEQENPTRTFTYAGKTFDLVDPEKLTKSAYMVEKGSATGSLYLLVDGAAEMVVADQRQGFIDWLLEDLGGSDDEQVSFEGLLQAIFASYEDATGRPLDKSGS